MDKCKCWELRKTIVGWHDKSPLYGQYTKQICNGTKEREECTCGGDVSKCDFYPEKRKEGKMMNTAEMWLKAQMDGKTYYWGDLKYQKDIGMVAIEDGSSWPMSAWLSFDYLMNGKWEPYQTMTKSEAEAKFNIKIVDD